VLLCGLGGFILAIDQYKITKKTGTNSLSGKKHEKVKQISVKSIEKSTILPIAIFRHC
jgi:hypothetical protein